MQLVFPPGLYTKQQCTESIERVIPQGSKHTFSTVQHCILAIGMDLQMLRVATVKGSDGTNTCLRKVPSTEAEQPLFKFAFGEPWVEGPTPWAEKCPSATYPSASAWWKGLLGEFSCVVLSWRDPALSLWQVSIISGNWVCKTDKCQCFICLPVFLRNMMFFQLSVFNEVRSHGCQRHQNIALQW